MSKTRSYLSGGEPFGTVSLFDLDAAQGRYRFRCTVCADTGVDEPGELCGACAAGVLTDRIDPATKTTKPSKPTKPSKTEQAWWWAAVVSMTRPIGHAWRWCGTCRATTAHDLDLITDPEGRDVTAASCRRCGHLTPCED